MFENIGKVGADPELRDHGCKDFAGQKCVPDLKGC